MDDLELLQAYADRHDSDAFAQLVQRHGNWLYAGARRQLGDGLLAEDVTQAVFLLLARRATRLRDHRYLSGWLFVAMGYCVREMKRQRSRTQRREMEVAMMRPEKLEAEADWREITPVLEAAVGQLGRKDRDAVLLRFYEQKPLAEVARLLGISESAAQKRVERAVGKLRESLAARGVHAEAVSLPAVLLQIILQPGPADLAARTTANIGQGAGSGAAEMIAKRSSEDDGMGEDEGERGSGWRGDAGRLRRAWHRGITRGEACAGDVPRNPRRHCTGDDFACDFRRRPSGDAGGVVGGTSGARWAGGQHKRRVDRDHQRNQMRFDMGSEGKMNATFSLDASKRPKWIDLTPSDYPEVMPGVYEMKGAELWIAQWNNRPASFEETSSRVASQQSPILRKDGSERTLLVELVQTGVEIGSSK